MANDPQANVNVNSNQRASEEAQRSPNDFESAIEACGFGLFNICLILVAIPGLAATVFETSTMSYVLPTAECDLKLSLMNKGVLNAITYAGLLFIVLIVQVYYFIDMCYLLHPTGMIIAAIPWGYIADTMGRKKVLVFGLLLNGVFVLCAALSQNFIQLIIFKFIGGITACGPFAVIMSYISEFHGRKHRSRVMMAVGIMKCVPLIVLPSLAFTILPHDLSLTIFGLKLQTWQVFIAVTSVPSLLSGSLLFIFPESPKFLMSQGRNDEALKAFQIVYAINKGKDKASYPIKALLDEAPEKAAKQIARANVDLTTRRSLKNKSDLAKENFIDGLKQLKPMFSHPYLRLSLLVYLMNFSSLTGQNSIRLWLPQIFASIVEYEKKFTDASSMCAIIDYNVNKTYTPIVIDNWKNCDVHITSDSYSNNIIVAASGLVGFVIASCLVNLIGNKVLSSICLFASFVCGSSLYWSTSALSTLIISSLFVTFCSIASTALISASVNIFPTSMRTMVIIMIMTCGRFGSLLGNILFPVFMSLGCTPPFLMVGSVMFCSCIISFFIPHTNQTVLK